MLRWPPSDISLLKQEIVKKLDALGTSQHDIRMSQVEIVSRIARLEERAEATGTKIRVLAT
jgi:hypothetical protein